MTVMHDWQLALLFLSGMFFGMGMMKLFKDTAYRIAIAAFILIASIVGLYWMLTTAALWFGTQHVTVTTITNCTGKPYCMQEGPREIMRKGADGTIEIEI